MPLTVSPLDRRGGVYNSSTHFRNNVNSLYKVGWGQRLELREVGMEVEETTTEPPEALPLSPPAAGTADSIGGLPFHLSSEGAGAHPSDSQQVIDSCIG